MRTLCDIMEFDHVIEVHPDGSITDGPAGVWAPELHGGELSGHDDWSLMVGWSGQDRYSGPIMHPSEFVGGGMEKYIRGNPGLYVCLVDYPDCGDDCEYCGGAGCEPDGWAAAYIDKEE